jgi:prophage DNA circulation protein
MPAGWDTLLQQGSWKGIAFEFVSVADKHSRDLDRQRFPLRPGANIEDRTRNELEITVRAVFEGDDYPETMNKLIAAIDEGGVGELVHPVFGTIQAACTPAEVRHDAEDGCDFATVEMTFVEHTESAFVFQDTSLASSANMVRTAEAAVDTAIAQLLDPDALAAMPDEDAARAACTLAAEANVAAETVATDIETNVDDLSASDITAAVNGVLLAIDTAQTQIANYTTPEAYGLGRALIGLSSAVSEMATLAIEMKPPLIQAPPTTEPMSLLEWVHRRYGDSSRAEEVLRLNSIADTFSIPAQARLWCYAF